MNTKFAKESFSGMPTWAKGVIGVGLLGIVIYVGYKLMKAPAKNKQGQGARQEDNAVNVELDKLISKGTVPKLTKAQLMAIANKLFIAFDGWGTDFPAVFSAFASVPTYADLLGVMSAYGNRDISSGKGNLAPNMKGTLSMAMSDELNPMERAQINALLKKNKIDFKF